MKKWVTVGENDFFNLDNIAHIWIEKTINGYFIMGEMIHNQEEVVLSDSYPSQEECRISILNKL